MNGVNLAQCWMTCSPVIKEKAGDIIGALQEKAA